MEADASPTPRGSPRAPDQTGSPDHRAACRAQRNGVVDREIATPRPRQVDGAGLTRRETDVLALLAGGSSNREISRQLYLSEKTVKAHLAAVFRKLNVTNRTQAAMAAVTMGMGPGRIARVAE